MMQFIVIENYKDTQAVYSRFKERGRMMPEGLKYISSWVTDDMKTCFQIMESDDPRLFKDWIDKWNDIVDFEVIRVISSEEAAERTKQVE